MFTDWRVISDCLQTSNLFKPLSWKHTAKKCIGTFDEQKKEQKHDLSTLDDLFSFAEVLVKTVENYDKAKELV